MEVDFYNSNMLDMMKMKTLSILPKKKKKLGEIQRGVSGYNKFLDKSLIF